jgi:hypothetical protein
MSFLTPLFAIAATSVCSNWWLTYWSNHGTASTQTYFLIAYAAINSISVLVNLGVSLITVYFGLQASRKVSTLCCHQLLAIALHAGSITFLSRSSLPISSPLCFIYQCHFTILLRLDALSIDLAKVHSKISSKVMNFAS